MIKYINRHLPKQLQEKFFWRVSRYFNHFYKNRYHFIETTSKPKLLLSGLYSDTISQQIFFLGYYDAPLTKLIKNIAQEGGVFVDVGANIGYCSILFASQHPTCKVVSFEPSLSNLELLKSNISINKLAGNINVQGFAVGDIETEMYFDNGPKEQTGWGHLSTEKTGQKVKVITLDGFFYNQNLKIDLLKIDVEGFDLQVILGCKDLLSKGLIKNIIFEHHHELIKPKSKLNDLAIAVLSLLDECNYKIERFAAHDYLASIKQP